MYFPLSSDRSLVTGNVESNVLPHGESVGSKEEEMVHAQLENDETDGNFENIKARLRPRKAQIDYFKVNVIASPPVKPKPPHSSLAAGFKRKHNDNKQGICQYAFVVSLKI